MAGKQKILIVDDDENIANLVSLYLTKECFDTRIEHDGNSALVAFRDYKPDLVLLWISRLLVGGETLILRLNRDSLPECETAAENPCAIQSRER